MKDPSQRDREGEFHANGLDISKLEKLLSESSSYIRRKLERLNLEDLDLPRTSPRDERQFTIGWSLAHALEHTALHVGHIQLTSQLWKEMQDTVGQES